MRRLIWIVPSAIAVALTGYLLGWPTPAPADADRPVPANSPHSAPVGAAEMGKIPALPTSPELPVTQIVLYSSGVGFFQREGYVAGNARVDLSFPVQDINDLLKSMVLQDLDGGQVSAVSYDSHDPIDKTLDGFAIQLTNNPCQADILNQARGERVEITLSDKNGSATAPATLQGTILGVEIKTGSGKVAASRPNQADAPYGERVLRGSAPTKQPSVTSYYRDAAAANGDQLPIVDVMLRQGDPAEVLNLWCADGMRSVSLADIQRVKFLNAAVEKEVARALEVLARAHDNQKKSVSLQFNGTGSRAVRVGYVVETPLWRTSYRLLVDDDGKLFVQGWALVDNPTNDDWKNVRMSLVSGRPISFKMDLYQPLYLPRPVVQQELFTSVRPTVHNGNLIQVTPGIKTKNAEVEFGVEIGVQSSVMPTYAPPPAPMPTSPTTGFVNGSTGFTKGIPTVANGEHYVDISKPSGIVAAASATDLGSSFEYAIDQPITIPRQKSALLPIVNSGLEGDKVCVFNQHSHVKYPLLALRFKNTTGVHLMQGPVAVFEGSNYCGDAQLPDIQPGEERLVSYALDLGTEVEVNRRSDNPEVFSLRIKKGIATVALKTQAETSYTLKNRSPHDRVVIVEHPYRPDCKVVGKDQPTERARDVYRFEVKVAAGESAKLEVVEEQDRNQQVQLVQQDANAIQWWLQKDFSDANAKSALDKLLQLRKEVTKAQTETARLEKQLADITTDQQRLRANLKEMPENAAAYKRYLEKFDSQETQIENLQTLIQTLRDRAREGQQNLEAYVNSLDMEATIRRSSQGK